jgi:hypothetical protein
MLLLRRLRAAISTVKRTQALELGGVPRVESATVQSFLGRTVIPSKRTKTTILNSDPVTSASPTISISDSDPSLALHHNNQVSRPLFRRKRLIPWWSNKSHYGFLDHFKTMITDSQSDRETFLIALDTESGGGVVKEVGITTLRVRDILGVQPGKHLAAWMPRMKHHHVCYSFFSMIVYARVCRSQTSRRLTW